MSKDDEYLNQSRSLQGQVRGHTHLFPDVVGEHGWGAGGSERGKGVERGGRERQEEVRGSDLNVEGGTLEKSGTLYDMAGQREGVEGLATAGRKSEKSSL